MIVGEDREWRKLKIEKGEVSWISLFFSHSSPSSCLLLYFLTTSRDYFILSENNFASGLCGGEFYNTTSIIQPPSHPVNHCFHHLFFRFSVNFLTVQTRIRPTHHKSPSQITITIYLPTILNLHHSPPLFRT